jgi:hypothetical protein
MFYFFQDARLLFPTFLITIPFVAREAVALLERARERRASSIALATLVGALIVASVIGLPRRRNQLGLERALNVERFEERGSHYHAVQLLNQAAAGHPALVLSTINPSYVSALASVSHVVLPLVRSMQPFREPLLVTRADRDARIEKALSENVPVYLVSTTAAEPARIAAPPPDYVWQPLQSSRGARILQLVRETEFNRNN